MAIDMSKDAMKLEKIMEQAQVFASAWSLVGGRFDNGNMLNEAEAAKKELRQMVAEALAEQPAQQEPVAWMDGYRNIYSLEEKAAGCPEATIALVPMANHKKTSGSPIKELNCICGAVWEGDELVHLPRPPAQRKPWVGLTDDEIAVLDVRYHRDNWKLIKEAEAKLKEKNT